MSILVDILDKQTFVIIFTAIFTVVYAYAAQRFLLMARERRKKRQFELRETISRGLLTGSIDSVGDLVNVYKGVHELGADDISYRTGLSKALRTYLVQIVSDTSSDTSETKRLKERVNAFLQQIESEAPFADLPVAERNLIIDVQKFMNAGDHSSANRKLEDLAGLVEVRQDALTRLQNSNKW